MSDSPVIHVDEIPEKEHLHGAHWGGAYKPLTPLLSTAGRANLGVSLTRCPPGRSICPFHTHAREDEVFYILSGQGVLRYGDDLYDLRAGHCVSCPAGSGIAHQMLNTGDEDLVYLSIGLNDPHEVCTYPDSGKVLVRALETVGRLTRTQYMDGESERPRIHDLVASRTET